MVGDSETILPSDDPNLASSFPQNRLLSDMPVIRQLEIENIGKQKLTFR
jgi:hypothetical protein